MQGLWAPCSGPASHAIVQGAARCVAGLLPLLLSRSSIVAGVAWTGGKALSDGAVLDLLGASPWVGQGWLQLLRARVSLLRCFMGHLHRVHVGSSLDVSGLLEGAESALGCEGHPAVGSTAHQLCTSIHPHLFSPEHFGIRATGHRLFSVSAPLAMPQGSWTRPREGGLPRRAAAPVQSLVYRTHIHSEGKHQQCL